MSRTEAGLRNDGGHPGSNAMHEVVAKLLAHYRVAQHKVEHFDDMF